MTKAVEWYMYEKSANLGFSTAMFNCGNNYRYKDGEVTKDLNQAREQWYTKAVAQGYAKAQTQLDQLNASNN